MRKQYKKMRGELELGVFLSILLIAGLFALLIFCCIKSSNQDKELADLCRKEGEKEYICKSIEYGKTTPRSNYVPMPMIIPAGRR